MSLFKRVLASENGGFPQRTLAGSGFPFNIKPLVKATNTDHTLTVAEMSGGMVVYSSFSAGRSVTTPTAALILAACPDMDIGDSFSFIVSCVAAFALTWVAGDSVTLAGSATVEASTWTIVTVTKTAATTVTWTVA